MSNLLATIRQAGAFSDKDAQLILELAAQISPLRDILRRYGLGESDLRVRMEQPGFKAALKEAGRVWASDLNVQERIRLKAAALVEDNLPVLHALVRDPDTGPTPRLKAFEQLSDLAVPKKVEGGAGTGARFQLNITVPGAPAPIAIEGEVVKEIQEDEWTESEAGQGI